MDAAVTRVFSNTRTNGANADGQVVWSWHPDAGVKFADGNSQATVANKPGAPGRTRSSR